MREILLGRTPVYSGVSEVITISIRLDQAQNPEHHLTVLHEPLPVDALNLSICGAVYERGRDVGGGQCIDTAATVRPGPWTQEDLDRLIAIWSRWHLNEMRAHCAHMELPTDTSYDARKDITCPETGYKYGSAWLFEPLPDDVLYDVRRFQRRLGYPQYTKGGKA